MLKKFAGVAAGTGVIAAATGCGIVPGLGASPVEVLQEAVQESRDASTYRAEVTSSGAVGEGPAQDTDMEILFSENPEPTMEITDRADGAVILVRGTEFLVEDSGQWYRLDIGEMTEEEVKDPKAQLDQLMAGDQVEETGDEEINGSATTRYEGSYGIDEALAEISDSDTRDAAEKMYSEAGVSEVPFSAWVGDDGLPKRVEYEIGDYTETVDFLEFGQEVNIDYPSGNEIRDMNEMFDDPFGGMDLDGDFGTDMEELEDMDLSNT